MVSRKIIVISCLGILIGITGCDKISSLFPSNAPTANNDKQSVPPSAVSSPTPSTNQKTTIAPDEIVRIGDWALTKDDFAQRLSNLKEAAPDFDVKDVKSQKLVLDELVNQQLLFKEAEKNGVGNKKEVLEAVNEFRRSIMVRDSINTLIASLQVSDQEVQDYYNENKDIFVEPADFHLREIMVPTQSEAKEILIELLKGTDFAEMAKTRSKSKSAANGGDLGFVKDLSPTMSRAIASIDVGGVSSVFKGSDGYYVLKLEEKKGGKPLAFADVKKDIMDGLLDLKRRDALQKHVDDLRKSENVQLNEGLIK